MGILSMSVEDVKGLASLGGRATYAPEQARLNELQAARVPWQAASSDGSLLLCFDRMQNLQEQRD